MTMSPVAYRKPVRKRGPLALVAFLINDLQVAVAPLFELAEDFACAVREQSSTTMICFLIGTARTRLRISWIVAVRHRPGSRPKA